MVYTETDEFTPVEENSEFVMHPDDDPFEVIEQPEEGNDCPFEQGK